MVTRLEDNELELLKFQFAIFRQVVLAAKRLVGSTAGGSHCRPTASLAVLKVNLLVSVRA